MSDIFISYATEDRPPAEMLANALYELGWSVWWDRELRAGSRFEDVIEQELGKACCVVVLWSGTLMVSGWVRDEAREGNRRKILVPALIERVQPPMGFRGVHTADLTHWRGEPGALAFQTLCLGIRAHVRVKRDARPIEAPAPAWRFTRRWVLGTIGIGVGAAVLAIVPWLTSGQGGPECRGLLGRPLRVGVVTWPGYAGGILANNGFRPNKDCIYYQKNNLCVASCSWMTWTNARLSLRGDQKASI